MGDFRANIKVSFEMFEKEFKQDFWINYTPDEETCVDNRITEWFSNCWKEFSSMHNEAEFERRLKEIEEKEYETYLKLKEKFEAPK